MSQTPSVKGEPGPKWISPLQANKPTQLRDNPGAARLAKRLFVDEHECSQLKRHVVPEPTLGTITNIYPAPCLAVNPGTNFAQHAQLMDMVISLEKTIRASSICNEDEARSHILGILQSSVPHELKLENLGLTLFYLDRNGKIPQVPSLIDFRAQDILDNIREYVESHAAATQEALIPTGKTHYLLRAFVHMVITSQQHFNQGGLLAIIKLLKTPAYGIAAHLQPEHREHILVIANNILKNIATTECFKDQVTIHPQLADIIRWDLKLTPEQPVTSVDVMRACLMALFTDIRQTQGPNCYAISALIYASENYTYQTLVHLLRWLQEGFYKFHDRLYIPLRPCLEKRVEHASDLSLSVATDRAYDLAPITHIFSTLNIEPAAMHKASPVCSIADILVSKSAQDLFHAYKLNCVAHLILKILEFINLNSAPLACIKNPATTASPYSLIKLTFIENCLTPIETACAFKKIPETVLDRLRTRLRECLWLEPLSENDVSIDKSWVRVGSEVISFKGNPSALAEVFQGSIRIFHLNGNQYTLLPTISSLQQVIADEIEVVCKMMKLSPDECRVFQRDLIQAVKTNGFRNALTHYIANQISSNKQGIDPKTLGWSDLLILKQKGGQEGKILELAYGISLTSRNFSQCSDPCTLLEHLATLCSSPGFDLTRLKNTPRILITTLGKHAWTLAPTRWKLIFENLTHFSEFLKSAFFIPARRFLNSQVSADTMARVIDRCTAHDLQLRSHMTEFFRSKQLTHRQFRDAIYFDAPQARYTAIGLIIEEEFSKVKVTPFMIKLVLLAFNLTLDGESFQKFYNMLPKAPLAPYQLALAFREALMTAKLAILDPYEIEIEICRALDLPLPFDMGDLNYLDFRSEDPTHIKLMIQYSWITEKPSYFRRGKTQTWENFSEYDDFELEFPSNLFVPIR